MVADDNLVFGSEIQKAMQNGHIEVNFILSKENAFEYFMRNEYCLVIIFLPPSANRDMEILRMMRGTKPIPIIALTLKLGLPEKTALFHAGANVCLEKPVNMELKNAAQAALLQNLLSALSGVKLCNTKCNTK